MNALSSNPPMNSVRQFHYDAVVAGYLGLDIVPGFPGQCAPAPLAELLRPGKLVQVEGLDMTPGGVVANTGLAMRKFGKRVALMGLVGKDVLGDILLRKLQAHGMTDGIRRTARAGTAYGVVIAPPGTDRIFLEDPGCNNLMASSDLDFAAIAAGRLFHFGYPTLMQGMMANGGAELRKLFARVNKLGVATSLDMTLPDPDSPAGRADWPAILSAVLPHVDVFAPSIEEILFMMEPKRYARLLAVSGGADIINAVPQDLVESLGKRILALGVKVVMIKTGHRGAYLRTGDVGKFNAVKRFKLPADNWNGRELWISACSVDRRRVKNACGAGDCAVAGFLTAMLNGAEIEKAGRYAMLAGRDNLYGADALSGLSSWKSMTGRILGELKA